ncbi:MAG: class I SAM-dependent methyltransferase [Bacteroidota bacterium]
MAKRITMGKSGLVKIFGFPATLIHGDPLVWDRWRWLKKHLPPTRNGEQLIDFGSGTGAFTIGSARRGYSALGLSWDERNQRVASERADICNTNNVDFEVLDLRQLHSREDLLDQYDVAICLEVFEHILDDQKLMADIAGCLQPGGRLFLTTPNYHNHAITKDDDGPYSKVEDGGHVRRGYTPEMLRELCNNAGLRVEEIDYCSGWFSQKLTTLMRTLGKLHPLIGWLSILPLRILPPLLDPAIAKIFGWPGFSITLEAYKPRYQD